MAVRPERSGQRRADQRSRPESIRAEAARTKRAGETKHQAIYRVRKERGTQRGLSLRSSVGHARAGEPTARELRTTVRIVSGGQVIEVRANTVAERRLATKHIEAWTFYRDTGDDSKLRPLAGKTVRDAELETDVDTLDEMGRAGTLHIEELYVYATGRST